MPHRPGGRAGRDGGGRGPGGGRGGRGPHPRPRTGPGQPQSVPFQPRPPRPSRLARPRLGPAAPGAAAPPALPPPPPPQAAAAAARSEPPLSPFSLSRSRCLSLTRSLSRSPSLFPSLRPLPSLREPAEETSPLPAPPNLAHPPPPRRLRPRPLPSPTTPLRHQIPNPDSTPAGPQTPTWGPRPLSGTPSALTPQDHPLPEPLPPSLHTVGRHQSLLLNSTPSNGILRATDPRALPPNAHTPLLPRHRCTEALAGPAGADIRTCTASAGRARRTYLSVRFHKRAQHA